MDAAWSFFSNPHNLAAITPPWLRFTVTSDVPETMYAGMILTNNVHPFQRISVNWITEITHVDAPTFFVDEQRFGPYRFWHHQHRFTAQENEVLVEDIVHYALPFGWLGQAVNGITVQRQLREIFAYRRKVLQERFER